MKKVRDGVRHLDIFCKRTSLFKATLLLLTCWSCSPAGVFDEFAPKVKEENYFAQNIDFSFRPLYYLGAIFPYAQAKYLYAIEPDHRLGFSLAAGLNDRYGASGGVHYYYRLFSENSSENDLGLKSEIWWDRAHPQSFEPSLGVEWLRSTKISSNSSFSLGIEANYRWGRGFRSRPSGFFDDINLIPFSLGIQLGYRFSWVPTKKLSEVQR